VKVKIVGIFESPVAGDGDAEVVVFEGAVGVGKIRVETNRYHRLEIELTAEPEGVLLESDAVVCRVCKNEIDDLDGIVCVDCEGDVR